jgi:hypothetical protein
LEPSGASGEILLRRYYLFHSLDAMPRPLNPNPIGKNYTKDLRDRVIHQKFRLQKKTTDIAIDLDMSLRVVQCTIKLWHDIRDVVAAPNAISWAPMMSQTQTEAS